MLQNLNNSLDHVMGQINVVYTFQSSSMKSLLILGYSYIYI